MALIRLEHITKDYGNGRGVFDLSFDIEQGGVFGFLGPNGAGKTTTIRQLLGFIHPDRGQALINGKEVSSRYRETNAHIGYLPGEISFPEGMKGTEYIRWCAELRGMKDLGRAGELLSLLTLGSFLLNLVVSGIAFLTTCASNSSAVATSVGAGLPLLFFLLHVVANFFGGSGLLGYCRYFTIHSLYSPADIIACNASMKGQFLLLAVMAAALYLAGGIIFRKKDLPL